MSGLEPIAIGLAAISASAGVISATNSVRNSLASKSSSTLSMQVRILSQVAAVRMTSHSTNDYSNIPSSLKNPHGPATPKYREMPERARRVTVAMLTLGLGVLMLGLVEK